MKIFGRNGKCCKNSLYPFPFDFISRIQGLAVTEDSYIHARFKGFASFCSSKKNLKRQVGYNQSNQIFGVVNKSEICSFPLKSVVQICFSL